MGLFNKTYENGQHRAVFKNLHGARAHKVDGLQSVPLAQQVLPGAQKEVLMCRDSDRRPPGWRTRTGTAARSPCSGAWWCRSGLDPESPSKAARRWKESSWETVLCSRQAVRPQGPFPHCLTSQRTEEEATCTNSPGFLWLWPWLCAPE